MNDREKERREELEQQLLMLSKTQLQLQKETLKCFDEMPKPDTIEFYA